jgi:hypothetical protein
MSAWYAKQWSDLILNGVAFPVYSDLDIQEEMTLREFGQLEDNLNGVMGHSYGTIRQNSQKVEYTWSSSKVRRPPAFFDLWRGDEFTAVPIEPWTAVLPAGQTQLILKRDPYPGSVMVEDQATGEWLPSDAYSNDGSRAVNFANSFGAPCLVGFKPIITLIMDSRTNGRGEFVANSASWRVAAKEK